MSDNICQRLRILSEVLTSMTKLEDEDRFIMLKSLAAVIKSEDQMMGLNPTAKNDCNTTSSSASPSDSEKLRVAVGAFELIKKETLDHSYLTNKVVCDIACTALERIKK